MRRGRNINGNSGKGVVFKTPIALKNRIINESAEGVERISVYVRRAIDRLLKFLKPFNKKLFLGGYGRMIGIGNITESMREGMNYYIDTSSLFHSYSEFIRTASILQSFGFFDSMNKYIKKKKLVVNVEKIHKKKVILPKGFEMVETDNEIRIIKVVRRLE